MTSSYKPVARKEVNETPPLSAQAASLWRASRNSGCVLCQLHDSAETVCMFGTGAAPAAGMVVGEAPTSVDDTYHQPLLGTPGVYLNNVLVDLDIDRDSLYTTNAVKCLPPRGDKEKLLEIAVKACAPYLEAELEAVKPKAVLAMGGLAYYFFAHKKGIIKQRGQAFFHEKYQCWVVPTVHPMFVMNNPTYDGLFIADVAMFKRFMSGQVDDPPLDIVEVRTLEDWAAAEAELWEDQDKILTFDLETRGFKDFDQVGAGYSQVWCAAFTRGRRSSKGLRTFMVPLEHPDSPFLAEKIDDWQHHWSAEPLSLRIADEYRPVVQGVLKLIREARVNGHNVKFDIRNALGQLARRYGIEGL